MKKLQYLFLFTLTTFMYNCSNDSDTESAPIIEEALPVGEFLDDWTFKVNPRHLDNFDIAEFRLWVPEDTSNLKAILVLSHSYNSNGLGLTLSESWRDYARDEQLGILAVHFKSLTSGFYGEASGGSGQALIKALDTLAYKNNLGNINTLPFVMRGYSAGGVFSYNFSAFKPNRVIAFSNIRGGSIAPTGNAHRKVPGLMLIAEMDNPTRNDVIINTVLSKRIIHALWAYAIEPNETHFGSVTNSDILTRQFFSSIIAERVTENSNELLDITESTGWLGNHGSNDYYTYTNYPGDKTQASWLLNEEFAVKWKDYQIE